MNLGTEQARSFVEPLKGKTTTFLVDDRETNISLMRCMADVVATTGRGCTVLDIDAFFASNSNEIFSSLSSETARSICIHIPEPVSEIENEVSEVFKTGSEVFVLQNLNTLYHLFRSSGKGSGVRKVAFTIICLSHLTKASGKVGVVIMYGRERVMSTGGGGGSISDFSDAAVLVESTRSEVSLRCRRGTLWPGGEFYLRLP